MDNFRTILAIVFLLTYNKAYPVLFEAGNSGRSLN